MMGIDLLDICFRIEKRYHVTLDAADLLSLVNREPPTDITAGDLHFLVGAKLREAGRPVPRSLWNGIRIALAEGLGVTPMDIKPGSWLIKELGMT